ncbi:MAG: hypothetical protein WCX88_01120 [Patescibacteria group bacterium]
MQFAVPQFIEGEAKIFAFLTVRQFVIMLFTIGAIVVLVVSNVNLILMVTASLSSLIIGGTLAFVKINGQQFHEFFVNMVTSIGKPTMRVWRKEAITVETILNQAKEEENRLKEEQTEVKFMSKNPINQGNLSKLSLLIDTGGAYKED